MAKVITVATNKGGTGKTTTAVNFGAGMRLRGYDVLVIDYDGQANVTDTLRVSTDNGTTYDTMKAKTTPYVQPVRVLPPGDGVGVLDVLPSCTDLSALETEMSNQPDRITRFATVVNKYRDKYDVVVIDTAPTLGLLTISAIYAADELIIPVQPQYLAVKGLLTLNDTITAIRDNKGEALPVRVLLTQYDKRKGLHRITAEQVEAAGFDVFPTRIRDNVALGEAPAVGLDIFRYDTRCKGSQDYNAVVGDYLNRIKIRHTKHGYK